MKNNKLGTMIVIGVVIGAIVGLIVQNFFLWLVIGVASGIIIGLISNSSNKPSQTM